MGEAIISGVSLGFCAILMLGIGIFQIRSKTPVGFYTGEKAPDAQEISDVKAWNRKHGMMFILYAVSLVLAWVCGLIIGSSPLRLIPPSSLNRFIEALKGTTGTEELTDLLSKAKKEDKFVIHFGI